MKLTATRIIVVFILSFIVSGIAAQQVFFQEVAENTFSRVQKRGVVPAKYRTLKLDSTSFLHFVQTIPSENIIRSRGMAPVIAIPMPEGGTARFTVWESSVLDPQLAAKYPGIRTFTGQGIDDPTANIKLDWTPSGFHAMILSAVNGAVFIDPYSQGSATDYIAYHKRDYMKAGKFLELPLVRVPGLRNRPASPAEVMAGVCVGSQLRTYRLALAANGEYTAFHGGTVAKALAAQATTMNRVNGVYERELSIRMVIVANNDLLIFTNSNTDPYTNSNPNAIMLTQNQGRIDSVIGNANYDIGHVFSTGGGGVAGLGVVCISGYKAQGVTGTSSPTGDPFNIDYVAHEMGHQFGAEHPFNSAIDNCAGNGTITSNAEPGSGSTIMGYAGICGTDDLQTASDAFFHAISLNEISDYTINGPANSCAQITATGNTPPTVNAGANYVIPKSTPFILSGGGTDANGDVLTYSWEQVNTGGAFGSWDSPTGNAPIFRSFIPVAAPVRYFPKLATVISNATIIGELLPSYARILNFRLTARDNRANGGGVCFDEMNVTVNGTAGPFVVTYPNAAGITWLVNDFKTITWNPAGTAGAPISCSNVKIELSIDGGLTYPVIIAASTPNDGTEEIKVPANVSNSARIRVMGVGNIFYDISNANFSIQQSPTTEFVFNNPVPVSICAATSASTELKTSGLNGFSTAVNLSATGNPAGTTVTFSTNPVAPGSATNVTLNNIGSLPGGTYNVTVNGVAGTVSKSRIISFTINGGLAAPGQTAPVSNAAGVVTLPTFNWTAVSTATSYTLEIATASNFTPVLQTVSNITTIPYTLTTALAENTVYYWRVKAANSCGSGTVSASRVFKTGITSCNASTNIPVSISQDAASTITSTLVIPANQGAPVIDLNISGLKGTHEYISDLTFKLTSPAGTTVVLFDQVCSSEKNFDLSLDDEATVTTFPCPPVGGVIVKPTNPLSAFDGENSAGTWTLTIIDNYSGDGGVLNGWGLCFFKSTPLSTAPAWTQLCPPASGTSLTSNLTGATYQWQLNTGSGFVNIANNANYAGVNSATLQITNAVSAWSGYQYRCVVAGVNSTVFTLGFANYWVGAVSNLWGTAGNWSCNAIPDANTDVFINSGSVVITSNAICRSLAVNPGASVQVNTGFKITVVR